MRDAHAQKQELLTQASEAERAETGTLERWSAKDVVAHCTYWQQRLTQTLAAARRGETPTGTSDDDLEDTNPRVFEQNRQRTPDEVLAEAERVFEEFIEQVSQLSEAELTDPKPFYWYNNRPLLASILGNSYRHPLSHISDYYLQRGELSRAREMQEGMAQALLRFDPTERGRGATLYNLACFYALSGERERALELLPQAMQLLPSLVEWSQQDSDLESLRELPEYQSLYSQ